MLRQVGQAADVAVNTLLDLIVAHEGFRATMYLDTRGVPTIGYGRNLRDTGITRDEAQILLNNDIDRTFRELYATFDWFGPLGNNSLIRQAAVTDLAFDIGVKGVSGFIAMISAIRQQLWNVAADAMLSSDWAREVGHRALDDAEMMRTGSWPA